MTTTKNKPVHAPEPVESDSDFDEGRFGWVWMELDGRICGICRECQPQSKRECIAGHPPFIGARLGGVPIPWQLAD